MSIRHEGYIGKCTEGDKPGEDVDNQVIVRLISTTNLLSASVYVGFRQSHPDKAIVDEAVKVMQANNIDVKHLVEWKADHCKKA
jgi:hypothetical protein